MKRSLRLFLRSSLAKLVPVEPEIVLHRATMSVPDLQNALGSGTYQVPRDEAVCELEVGGQVLARGRIVERGGACWFRVEEVL